MNLHILMSGLQSQMSDSEQGFQTKNIFDFEIVKRVVLSEKHQSTNSQLVSKQTYCIYPNIKLYKYPSFIDRITDARIKLNTPDLQPLKSLFCHLLPLKSLQSLNANKVCTFNKFNENFTLKQDITILLKNVNLAVKNDMIRCFDTQLQNEVSQAESPYSDFLTFTSNFQSGNLMAVFKSNAHAQKHTYYLLLQNDTNTHGYNQWFFFYVKPNWDKITDLNVTVRLVIINVSKQIRYCSDLNLITCQSGQWAINTPYLYYQNVYRRYDDKNLSTIDFQYKFDIRQNQSGTFFCLGYPYTYSRLTNFLGKVNEEESIIYDISLQSIGQSEGRNQMPMLRIMHRPTRKIKKQQQKVIIVIARQHPCETVASYVVESLISCLLNPQINKIQTYIWYIFPMLNPDGVIHGHSRTNLNGYDLNRCWDRTQLQKCQQNQHVDRQIANILAQFSCQYVIDLHGHSKQFDCFGFYSQKNSAMTKLNYLLSQKIRHYNFSKSKYGLAISKRATFRGQMFHRFEIANAITIETSLYGYEHEAKRYPWQQTDFTDIALGIVSAVSDLKDMRWEQSHKIDFEIQRLEDKQKKKVKSIDRDLDSDSDPENEYLLEAQRQEIICELQHDRELNGRKCSISENEDHLKAKNMIAVQEKPLPVPLSSRQRIKFGNQLLQRNRKMMKTHYKFMSHFDNKTKQSPFRKSIYTNSNSMHDKNVNSDIVTKNIEDIKTKKQHMRTYQNKSSHEKLSKIHGTLMRSQCCIMYPTMSNVKIEADSPVKQRVARLAQSLKFNTFDSEIVNRKKKANQLSINRYSSENKCQLSVGRMRNYRFRR